MNQIGLLGLCFCILVSGVRGQEVITKTLHTGMPTYHNLFAISESENLEILSFSGKYNIYGNTTLLAVYFKPIGWQLSDGFGANDPDRVMLKTGDGFNPVPIILGGPGKFFVDPDTPLNSIAYRIVPKAGYSPNISPTSLASNTNFVSGLTQTILSTSNSYGLATRTELIQALAESRADGINSVISNPNLWTLYTTNQIQAMAIGDLVLTSTNNGEFVLNYDIEQSEDLVNWTPYQIFQMPLTNLPINKAFVRIKLKNQQ